MTNSAPSSNAPENKKAKKKKEPDVAKMPVLPNDLAEHAQALAGMTSEEIIKLLESLGRINDRITVSRRRQIKGKNTSKLVGGKQKVMSIQDAVGYEKSRAEARREKEQKVKELHHLEGDLVDRLELNDEIYPKRLTPKDIVRGVEAAKERLEELDRLRARQTKIIVPKEDVVLHVLELIKKLEAARVARTVAAKQRESVIGKTIEELEAEREARIRRLKGEPDPIAETPEEKTKREQQTEEKKQALIRSLTGFDKNIKTLTEEAGEMAGENIEAAAAVVRQWIGNRVQVNEEE